LSVRSGRKRRLTEEEGQRMREEYLYGRTMAEEAMQRSPKALAAKYNVSPSTVYDYVYGRARRKRRLAEEVGRRMREEYLYGQALGAQARERSPKALAVKYNVSPSTIYDYVEARHKGEAGYEAPREGVREIIRREQARGTILATRGLEGGRGLALIPAVS